MKKITLSTFLCLLSYSSFSQEKFRFYSEAANDKEITVIPAAESVEDDAFDLYAYLPLTSEKQEEFFNDFDGPQFKLTLNGHEIELTGFQELYEEYSFQKEDDEQYAISEAMRMNIDLSTFVQSNSGFIKSTSNVLELMCYFKDELVGKGAVSFNIPEYGNPQGDFCDLKRFANLGNEELAVVKEEIAANFPNSVMKAVFYQSVWVDEPEENQSYAGLFVVLEENGKYSKETYLMYRKQNVFTLKPRDVDETTDLNKDCVNALLK